MKIQDWVIRRFPLEKAESPIEALFYASFVLLRPHLRLPDSPVVILEPQAALGAYRADFLFKIKSQAGDVKRLVVELDGHNFHEKTKEQASTDKARDRWMTGQGIVVLRFSGSDVWNNPFACCQEVADRIYMLLYGVSRKEAAARAGFEAIRRILEE
ncbi:endonuclease domain-containing protein [Lysobacter enzymogenes]|uniref:endonuclease domain-containing protein n=1 Tax=Lysobacter enzymogenes TaxID=69 RepID=UPI00147DB983|nr:DUF559 domain-containing protein [Lysobacter enzymogenes]